MLEPLGEKETMMSDGKAVSSPSPRLTAALAGFGLACLAFCLSVSVLVPITGAVSNALGVPDAITAVLVLLEIFALPIVAGLAGVVAITRRTP